MRLQDVEKTAQKYSTFEIVPRSKLEDLDVGRVVKVMIPGERFWVKITRKNPDGSFNAAIANLLITHRYSPGTIIKIKKKNIIDVE
jgi:hypothetical protein